MSSFNEKYQEVKENVTENEQLKYVFLVAAFICSVVAVFKVAEVEVNTWVGYAVTPDEKSFLKWVMAAISVFTPIVIPIVIILKKSGLKRWFWAGVPLATILSLFQLGSLCHVFLKMGHNSSEVHKKESMGTSALKSAIDRISSDTGAIVVDAGTDKAVEALEKNEQLAKEKTALLKCPKKKLGAACRKEHKANIEGLETELAGLSSYQSYQHESAQQKAENIKIALDLRNAADENDARVYAAPAFRFMTKDNDFALQIQKVASLIAAGVVWLFEAFSMFLVGGLAASLKITQAFTGRIKSRLRSDEMESDSPTLSDSEDDFSASVMDEEGFENETSARPESFADRLRSNPDNLYAAFQNAPAYSGRNINTATAFNPATVSGVSNTVVKMAEKSVSEPVFNAENTPVCIQDDTNTDTNTVKPAENTDSGYQKSSIGFNWDTPSFKATTGGVVDGIDTGKPVIRWPENKSPVFEAVEERPAKVDLKKTVSDTVLESNTVENTDSNRDKSKMIAAYLREHKADFFANKKKLGTNAVMEFIRGNGMPINQADSTKSVKILLDEGFPQTRDEFNAEKAGE